MMEDVQMLEAVERYIRGEMNADEVAYFENLRKSNPEIDQLVVEQTMFFHQLGNFSDWKNYKSTLHEVHNQLLESGDIKPEAPKAIVVELWKKYKRVMAVAATIAGVTTLMIATAISIYTHSKTEQQVQQLKRDLTDEVNKNYKKVENKIDAKINEGSSKAPKNISVKTGGTGFLIDARGYLVTNAHVIKNASSVIIQNNKGQEFKTEVVLVNTSSDLAILRIKDEDFKPLASIPYSIRKSGADLGEQLFTLGFPRNEIVYNEGYMSAKTGYKGDTLTCQIGVPANPGNSGGPVFNKNGEVVGIINTRQTEVEGAVFAVTAKNLFRLVEEAKKQDSATKHVKLPITSSIKNVDRPQQIKRIEECVFMVKSY